MGRRARIWLVVAVLFSLLNLAGAGWAALQGEQMHAATHVALMLLGVLAVWRLAMSGAEPSVVGLMQGDARLEQLQQSVDAIAIEVERIGESQRFNERLKAERREKEP